MPIKAPYGTWKSPITSDLIAAGGALRLGFSRIHKGSIYWVEGRPAEGGRNVLMWQAPDSSLQAMTPEGFNVRTRAHEYGGGAYTLSGDDVYFCNDADQRIYRQRNGETPVAITAEAKRCYADLRVDERRNSLIAVCEDHQVEGREAENYLLEIDLISGHEQVLARGYDFYSSPRLSADGHRLAWLSWRHPNMPWDGTELWLAERQSDGTLANKRCVAGGEHESIFQPEWSPSGELYFVSDRSGWWNLYRERGAVVEEVCAMTAEFGLPQWVFGLSTYGFTGPEEIVCSYAVKGLWSLATIDLTCGLLQPIPANFSDIGFVSADVNQVVFSAATPTESDAVIALDLATKQTTTIRRASELAISATYFSVPELIEFPTENNLSAFGFFYRPTNADFLPNDDEQPPLIVISHGGPTSATSNAFKLGIQYWTSRGFAVVDVNYGGSSGLGRDYRRRLYNNWGIVDVADCVNAARYLLERNDVDGNRLIIRGSSAGGYTTLCALTFYDCFKAGASYYGVSDLTALAEDTHKFESRYLDRLIGPYPAAANIYRERSPINYVDKLSAPAIFLQGLEDKVVPPNQAETMVSALKKKGVPVAYISFAAEQHGFRRSETLKRALDVELYFYAHVFGFNLPETIEPIEIHG